MLDTLAFGLVVPILPKLVVQFNGGDMASAARQVGLFSFVFAAMQFLFSPVIGSLSDRLGRRPIVLLSNLGMGCDYILMALAPSLSWLLVGRMISGLTSASFPTAMADITEPEKRAGKIGMLGAAFGLGVIIGPATGGFLASYGLRYGGGGLVTGELLLWPVRATGVALTRAPDEIRLVACQSAGLSQTPRTPPRIVGNRRRALPAFHRP